MKKYRGAGRERSGSAGRLALAILTCVNLLLTLTLAVMRRQDTLKAVRGDGKLRLLLEQADGNDITE